MKSVTSVKFLPLLLRIYYNTTINL